MSGSVSNETCALFRGFGGSISQIYGHILRQLVGDGLVAETHLHLVIVRTGHERELHVPVVAGLEVLAPSIEDEPLRVGGRARGRRGDPRDDRRQHDALVRGPCRGLLELR